MWLMIGGVGQTSLGKLGRCVQNYIKAVVVLALLFCLIDIKVFWFVLIIDLSCLGFKVNL